MTLDELLAAPQFSLRQREKEQILLPHLNALTKMHAERCVGYARIQRLLFPKQAERLADSPYLPVGIFKTKTLSSIPPSEVFRVVTSSGTSGQSVSRITLDKATSHLQTTALSRIMTYVLGQQRLPMLIVDSATVLKNKSQPNARAAAVLGMMNFGRDHFFALNEAFEIDEEGLNRFMAKVGDAPFFIFGFTFLLWSKFLRPLRGFSQATLIHAGGWKKMQEMAVGNAEFKEAFRRNMGIQRVYNFYGMAEQTGSVYLEGEDGLFYPPNFADVVIRDPSTWQEAPVGVPGLIQVLSLLPHSYPGHSILTEDLGVLESVDAGIDGRFGKGFRVLGRMEQAELRGCSDTHAAEFAA